MATTVASGPGTPSERARGNPGSFASRVRRFVRFGLVGMSGVLVNEAALAALVDVFHLNYLLGAVLATQCSTVWNFTLVEWWAFEGIGARASRWRRFVMFWAVNMVALGLRGPILALLTSVFHVHYLISNLVSLGVLVVLRFAVADSLIWGKRPAPTRPVAREDLLTHFPRDLAEDLGWMVNPVAEAAELVEASDHEHASDDPEFGVAQDAADSSDGIEGRRPKADPRRYGSIVPPAEPARPPTAS